MKNDLTVEERERLLKSRYMTTFASMTPWLPETCREFLDIGCGSGGIALLVALHYQGRAKANLIDAEGPQPEWVGWHQAGAAWEDVNIALALFRDNLPGFEVAAWPPRADARVPECDLVYSNASWGHHYPIETYIPLVERCLAPHGTIIVDLRVPAARAQSVMADHFRRRGTIIVDGKKFTRTVWSRS